MRRLQKRSSFLRAAKGDSVRRKLVVVQTIDRADGTSHIGEGFTTTKKIGGAVVRNRARRRLREVSRMFLPELGRAGHDYVFIARQGTAVASWPALLDDVKNALLRLHRNPNNGNKRS